MQQPTEKLLKIFDLCISIVGKVSCEGGNLGNVVDIYHTPSFDSHRGKAISISLWSKLPYYSYIYYTLSN